MSKRGAKLCDKDAMLFREAMADVRAASIEKRHVAHSNAPIKIRKTLSHLSDVHIGHYSDPVDLHGVDAFQVLQYHRPSVRKSILKKLRRGMYPIVDQLDLHHSTVDEARALLASFIATTHSNAQSCVRIIHGKGYGSPQQKPRLKGMVNAWLRQEPRVLAFCSAAEKDGGTGALYVYLKNNRP